ncbi:MAG: two-component sensor histidine kinase [Verrucomicrobiaceae bacterium]|nr:two-component sensor histidine kinase [Verrucomicrobiaceae bacterium]
MRPRLTFFLLVLVVLPLALLGWVGRLLWVSELEREKAARLNSIGQQLHGHEESLQGQVQAIAARCSGLLAGCNGSEISLRGISAAEPLVRHAFSLNVEGRLLIPYPLKPATLSSQDQAFLARTASIWHSGRALGQVQAGEGPAPPPAPRGWHVWYDGEGPQFLYWQRTTDGRTLGVEVERAAFLAALLGRLPSATVQGCIRLAAADGAVLYHEGAFEPAGGASPQLTWPCASPMHHWHWEYFTAPGARTGPVMWPWVLGFCGTAALFASISLLVFTTYRRHMRQAAQRVSFVNQVSHELKTPLTNIRLYTDLARDAGPADAARYLNVVEEEASRLSRLIHNVLTFARQDRQELEVHAISGDLGALVSRVVESWRPAIQRKNIAITVSQTLVHPVRFDADATEQILGNLLSNIEKYAIGATTADIRLGERAGFGEVRVSDNGPGIPAKALRQLFQPFFRARSDLTEGVSGTGLGLSIARGLAEAQSGTLECSVSAQGAAFLLRLPIAEGPAQSSGANAG